jgi:glycosyltransferase involved in cell wall biosynthesis
MTSPPRISIVTISFNQAKFLDRAIRSVLEQDYPNIEYIVVDPGSTDASRELIERYRSRIARIVFEPDNGPADGLNKGFSFASGEIFAYLNSDDFFLQHAFWEAANVFTNEPQVDVVSGHGFLVNEAGLPFRRFRSPPFDVRRFALGYSNVMQQSTYFSRAIYEKSAGFNVQNITSWDGELMLDFALKGARFRTVNKYMSGFTIHSNSISGSQRRASESTKNHDRYFRRVMGRNRTRSDEILETLAWLDKQIVDPINPFVRLADRLIGCPDIPPELIAVNHSI